MSDTTPIPHPVRLLRDSAPLRSAAYLGAMVGVLLASMRLPRNAQHPFWETVHPYAFPGVVLITDAFTRLRLADRAAWTRPPTRRELDDFARGMALGTLASLSVLGVAVAKGWISAPAWGWEAQHDVTPADVAAAVGWASANVALAVYNEEQIFRGYGLDTLREALGSPGAVALSSALFARYHGPGAKPFLGLGLAGLFLACCESARATCGSPAASTWHGTSSSASSSAHPTFPARCAHCVSTAHRPGSANLAIRIPAGCISWPRRCWRRWRVGGCGESGSEYELHSRRMPPNIRRCFVMRFRYTPS